VKRGGGEVSLVFACHPERSEGSLAFGLVAATEKTKSKGFFGRSSLRMTKKLLLITPSPC
jgi:hypothetical protein